MVRYSCSQPPDLIPLQTEVELEEVIFQTGWFANPNKPCPVGQHYSRWAEYRWSKEGCAAWSHWTHGSLSPQRPQLIMWPLHRSENKSVLRIGLISYPIKFVKYKSFVLIDGWPSFHDLSFIREHQSRKAWSSEYIESELLYNIHNAAALSCSQERIPHNESHFHNTKPSLINQLSNVL